MLSQWHTDSPGRRGRAGVGGGQPGLDLAGTQCRVNRFMQSIGNPQNAANMGSSTGSTQPAVMVVDITDLTAVNAGMDLLEQDAMPLQSMPLRARRVIVRLESATVVYHSTNLRVRTRTRSRDGRTAGSSRLRRITRSHVSGNAYRSPSCAALLASASALSRVPSRRSWGCRRWHT